MDTLSDTDRLLCAATGRLLQAAAAVAGALGLGCSLLAAAALLLNTPQAWAATLALLLLPAERVLALRLRFDAGLFDALARLPQATLGQLDTALHALSLRAPSAVTAPRPLVDRIAGAERLALWHAAVVLAQAALLALLLIEGGGVVLLEPAR